MKIYLLCASVVIFTGLINAAEQAQVQESEVVNKHLIEDKIAKYEGLLSNVEHSQSVAKDSLGKHYKKYLEDLHSLQRGVEEGKERINIPQQLHSIFLLNHPEGAAFSY